MVFTSTSREPRLARRRSRRGEKDYDQSPDFRAATLHCVRYEQLDNNWTLCCCLICPQRHSAYISPHPRWWRCQCWEKKKKDTSALSPCNLCSPPHKAHNPYHIAHQLQLNGRLGVKADEKAQLSLSVKTTCVCVCVFINTEGFLFLCRPWTQWCKNTWQTTQWSQAIYVHVVQSLVARTHR